MASLQVTALTLLVNLASSQIVTSCFDMFLAMWCWQKKAVERTREPNLYKSSTKCPIPVIQPSIALPVQGFVVRDSTGVGSPIFVIHSCPSAYYFFSKAEWRCEYKLYMECDTHFTHAHQSTKSHSSNQANRV